MATTEKWAKLFKSRHQYMDSVPVQFGDAKDVAITWDGTNLTVKPVTDNTGAFIIGDGTTDMDFKVFMNTSAKYVLFDQDASLVTLVGTALTLGADTAGTDFKLFGTTTGNYLLWDASEDDLTLVGTATQLAIAGTTAADSATTGSIHTAGGIGIAGALWVGTTSRLVGAVTSSAGISNTGDVASSVTMTTPSLRSASTGAVNLIINASSTGTIGIGSTSTGVVTITPATTITGLLTTTGGITNNSAGIAAAGAISGATTIAASTSVTVTSASASALAVGRLGATTPALVVDASTATSITGISIKSAASGGGVAVAAVGESSVALTINAAGTGTIGIGSVSTGAVTITPATTITGAITASSTLGIAGLITSTSVTGFRSNPTFVPDTTYTNYAFSVGNKVAELTVNFAQATGQNFNPIQAIVNCTATGTGPEASSQTNLFFAQLTHDTNAMTNLRLKCADFTTIVGVNVRDAYAYQGEITFTGATAVGGEACVMGLVMNASTNAVTGGVRGLKISMGGSGLPAATSAGLSIDAATAAVLAHAIYIETQGGTTITNGLYMGNAGTFTNAIYLGGTITNFLNLASAGNSGFVTTGGTDCTASAATDPSYTLKVIVPGGAAGYIRVWAAA